jgi:hypothetical protein
MGFHEWFSHRSLVGEYGNVFLIARLYLQHEGSYGDILTKMECDRLVEENLSIVEYVH